MKFLPLLLLPALALAQECPRPVARSIVPIQTAQAQDEAMAQNFELASASCAREDMPCDEARAKCGGQLTQTLQQQVTFDEGLYLRDMLIAYQGQQYRMTAPIASATPLTDVSCNADQATLKTAGARRHVQAERRKLLAAEYPKWQAWVGQQYQLCQERAAAEKVRVDAAAAEAARALAATEALKKAEELKAANSKAADQAAKDKDAAAASAKAAEAKKAQDLVDAENRRQAELARAEKARLEGEKQAAADKAEAERRLKETAEERAARQRRDADDAKIVADREAAKANAAKRQQDLIDKERVREENVKLSHEQARQAADAAHQRKLEELRRNLEFTEAERTAALAAADKQYADAEAVRREQVKREIAAAGVVDHSDERLNGALSAHAAGGYFSFSDPGGSATSAPLIGGQVTIRQGFWGVAPAAGMAAGVELRATGLFLTAVDGKSQVIAVSPEIRYWFGRLSLGAAFEWQLLNFVTASAHNVSTISLGPTISLAAIDNPDGRLLFTLRWLPFVFLGNQTVQAERLTGEIEGGYGIFSFAVQGGALKEFSGGVNRIGWFVGLGLGARLRW